MLNRRHFFASAAAVIALTLDNKNGEAQTTPAGSINVADYKKLSDEDWRKRLSSEAYYVLRKHGTERAGTSPLNHEKRKGTFACAGCGQPLFSSETKFESGTGWPSFYRPLSNAVETQTDRSFFMARTEVHCARCLGHLGHVFEDGPKPTGLRYCMNGVSLKFEPAANS